MADVEVFVFLLAAIAVLAALGQRLDVPAPIALVIGGLALGFVPGLPAPQIDPDVVLFVFLPPLLYYASFTASAYELWDNALPIGLLAIGLVLVTVVAVAAVGHALLHLPWSVAFVLGAVLGPTDPVSATSVLRRLGAPQRIVTILEGESLVNDGTALTAYVIALGAVGSGSVSLGSAALEFVAIAAGGIAIGLAAGFLVGRLRSMFSDPSIDVTLSVLTPFAAYTPAQAIGASGVLAAVSAGLYVGNRSLSLVNAESRLRTRTFWEALDFLLNSMLFLLIGLQLTSIVGRIDETQLGPLLAKSALVALVVVGVRLLWMGLVPTPVGAIAPFRHQDRASTEVRERLVVGWSAMRGALSLAAALAIPLTVDNMRFPHRDLVIVVTYVVVILTLVVPGLTLPALIERLGLGQGEALRRAEAEARARITSAALERLNELVAEGETPEQVVERLRERYEAILERVESELDEDRDRDDADVLELATRVQEELLRAERETLAALERDREYPAEVLRRLQAELDLEESRLRARAAA